MTAFSAASQPPNLSHSSSGWMNGMWMRTVFPENLTNSVFDHSILESSYGGGHFLIYLIVIIEVQKFPSHLFLNEWQSITDMLTLKNYAL
jgi:hypothetical protein